MTLADSNGLFISSETTPVIVWVWERIGETNNIKKSAVFDVIFQT
jgi:hypothetical protein